MHLNLQVKYHDAHEKSKGHYMANTLVDFPEVIHSGKMEKMKIMVSNLPSINSACSYIIQDFRSSVII